MGVSKCMVELIVDDMVYIVIIIKFCIVCFGNVFGLLGFVLLRFLE